MVHALELNPTMADPSVGHARRAGDLPVLQSAIADWPCPPAKLVLVTHVLDTAVPYVRHLSRGMELEAVVPVPYSAQPEALRLLANLPVSMPVSIDDVGIRTVRAARRAATRSGPPVVIQEVGGYCADSVEHLAAVPGVRGVVEDTKQGQ